jgi:hypothetical protein
MAALRHADVVRALATLLYCTTTYQPKNADNGVETERAILAIEFLNLQAITSVASMHGVIGFPLST